MTKNKLSKEKSFSIHNIFVIDLILFFFLLIVPIILGIANIWYFKYISANQMLSYIGNVMVSLCTLTLGMFSYKISRDSSENKKNLLIQEQNKNYKSSLSLIPDQELIMDKRDELLMITVKMFLKCNSDDIKIYTKFMKITYPGENRKECIKQIPFENIHSSSINFSEKNTVVMTTFIVDKDNIYDVIKSCDAFHIDYNMVLEECNFKIKTDNAFCVSFDKLDEKFYSKWQLYYWSKVV